MGVWTGAGAGYDALMWIVLILLLGVLLFGGGFLIAGFKLARSCSSPCWWRDW